MNTKTDDRSRAIEKACVQACNDCAAACDTCAAACVVERHADDMAQCILNDLDCAALCRLVAEFVSRNSPDSVALSALCATACERCARECARHDLDHCRQCAAACTRCAAACKALVR